MKPSQALEAVGRMYIPGVVAFYENQKPDPWQEMHDALGRTDFSDDEIVTAACERFVSRAKVLVDRFIAEGKAPKRVTDADGLAMGSRDRFDRWYSAKTKKCIHCDSQKDLRLQRDEKEELRVVVVCGSCKKSA